MKRHAHERKCSVFLGMHKNDYTILSCWKHASSQKAQYIYLFTTMSISLYSMLPNLVNILITSTDYLAGRLYLCIPKHSRGSQNGRYLTYWNNKTDFVRGTIFPNDRKVSYVLKVHYVCIFLHLIRSIQIMLTCVIHCIVTWTWI